MTLVPEHESITEADAYLRDAESDRHEQDLTGFVFAHPGATEQGAVFFPEEAESTT